MLRLSAVVALLLSALIHFNLINSLSSPQGEGSGKSSAGDQGEKQASMKVHIIDKKAEQEKEKRNLDKGKSTVIVPPQQQYVDHPCDKWYGGIGVVLDRDQNMVTSIGVGYPAERAGVMIGDILVSSDIIKGTPGTYVSIDITRNGIKRTVTLVREKVCID